MIRNLAWEHAHAVMRPALALASADFLEQIASRLDEVGVRSAVRDSRSAPVVDWMLTALSLQGISDAAAFAFDARHGGIRSAEIAWHLRNEAECERLQSYWAFDACGYRKAARTCAEPVLLDRCPLPRHALRKGGLNVAAYGLQLFVRDICDGDLVGWIDARLIAADPGEDAADRAATMREAIIAPLTHIPNTGHKLWSMILADLLLAGDSARERWVTTGASFVAVDTLVHSFLHRTGILLRFDAEHRYGDACYAPNGCAEIIGALADHIDAREFNPDLPHVFPRFVQFAIWQFCAADHWNICNGNRIHDRRRCRQSTCPSYRDCDRIGPHMPFCA